MKQGLVNIVSPANELKGGSDGYAVVTGAPFPTSGLRLSDHCHYCVLFLVACLVYELK